MLVLRFMDGSSYSNCDDDKTVASPSFVSNCFDEQVIFISFLVNGGRRGSIMAESKFYECIVFRGWEFWVCGYW